MKKLLLPLCLAALCGCNSVGYSRLADGTEKFSARGLFMKVNANNLSVGGRTGTNVHGLTVKAVTGAGDVEALNAVISTAITTAVKAAKTP